MPIISTGPENDTPPVAVADSFSLNAQQAAAVTEVTYSYVDMDPTSPTFGQEVLGSRDIYGARLDVTANDTDVNPNDAGHFWIFNLTQPKDAQGNQVGSVTLETDALGHQYVRYYNPNPNESQAVSVTFSYQAGDQWAAPGAPAPSTLSAPVSVTVKVGGNAYQGQVINGLNHPQAFTPDSTDPRILYHLLGNDTINGGNQHDTIDGGAGADLIHGNNGTDLLFGGAGADRIYGDNGSDTLNGGAGNDTLTGGNSPDRFVFDWGFGADRITDFDVKNDSVAVDHNAWGSWESFISSAQQVGSCVVVTSMMDGSSITFENLTLKALQGASAGFIFT